MYKSIFIAAMVLFCYGWTSAQNNVGVGTATPSAKLEVRGMGIGYDVFKASNDLIPPWDSGMVLSSRGNLGLGLVNPGTYRLLSLGSPAAFSPQLEVWQGNPNAGGTLLGDINDVAGFNGSMNLYIAGTKTIQLRAYGTTFLNGGPVGIGVTTPMEFLHVNGAIIVGAHAQIPPLEVPGTIEWDGANFRGYNGTSWLNLDAQNTPDNDWLFQLGAWAATANPELVPMMPPTTISMGFPGDPNQGGILWIPDRPTQGVYPHQLMLESTTNAILSDASMLFRMSDWSQYPNNPPLVLDNYSMGIFRGDMSFKIYRGAVLAGTNQGDNNSMFRANASGIIDLPNQSRVRAYQVDPNGISLQLIPPNVWIPVNFNFVTPLPQGYDEQTEFILAASVNQIVPPENAYFKATKEGYYQVNARCEFDVNIYQPDPHYPQYPGGMVAVGPNSYVSIAIYTGFAPPPGGGTSSYAIGNNLQIGYVYFNQTGGEVDGKLVYNNAPNVSDVVYLQAGQIISIWVFHTALTPMDLIQGKDKIYVSIHKVS